MVPNVYRTFSNSNGFSIIAHKGNLNQIWKANKRISLKTRVFLERAQLEPHIRRNIFLDEQFQLKLFGEAHTLIISNFKLIEIVWSKIQTKLNHLTFSDTPWKIEKYIEKKTKNKKIEEIILSERERSIDWVEGIHTDVVNFIDNYKIWFQITIFYFETFHVKFHKYFQIKKDKLIDILSSKKVGISFSLIFPWNGFKFLSLSSLRKKLSS